MVSTAETRSPSMLSLLKQSLYLQSIYMARAMTKILLIVILEHRKFITGDINPNHVSSVGDGIRGHPATPPATKPAMTVAAGAQIELARERFCLLLKGSKGLLSPISPSSPITPNNFAPKKDKDSRCRRSNRELRGCRLEASLKRTFSMARYHWSPSEASDARVALDPTRKLKIR